MRGRVSESAEPRGGAGSRKFAAGAAPPGWSGHLWESLARGGFLAAESRSGAPPRGRPPSPGGEEDAANLRGGHPGSVASFPRRRAHASSSAAGASQPRAAPAAKARGRSCARPGPGAAGSARRSRRGGPAGQPDGGRGGTQPARSSPGPTGTAVCTNRHAQFGGAPRAGHLGEGDAAQPGAWLGARTQHPSGRRRAKVSKVWEGAGGFLKETSLLGPRGVEEEKKKGGGR